MKEKVGEVVKVGINYDHGDEEESNWPDKDIAILGSDSESGKKRRKKQRKEKIEEESMRRRLRIEVALL